MNDRIQFLLRHKPADQLDEAERAEVLEEMSLSEYDRLQRTLATLHRMDADAAPPPALRGRLLAHGRAQGHFGPAGSSWWQGRVPVWQAAAAALLFAAAVFFFYNAPRDAVVQEKIVEKIIVRRDTVFSTDTLWRRQVIVRYRNVSSVSTAPVAADALPVETPPQAMSAPAGTSIGDMPALMEFLGGAEK